MIYLIGGAPRSGKSILAQQLSAKLKIGWISTDVLIQVLKAKNVPGTKVEWNAAPEAISAAAEWFFPCLERFVWGVSSLAERYVIEGVDVLPAQIAQLSAQYQIRSVFLGCSNMTLERFDQFPGCSHGYASLPKPFRQKIVHDVPRWSEFVRQEAQRFGYPYIDTSDDFAKRNKSHTEEQVLFALLRRANKSGVRLFPIGMISHYAFTKPKRCSPPGQPN